ncbi:MAG TPA: hypothetical protein PLD57_15350 [Aggregatilineales bacterium]|nr:hypothetical protein [Chloroflexota bacterium]HOA25212.1 hypothetical protein [Aggregatilineales bacterium]HPV08444.1 hypothetical protein [Aggregatilineales bacterium]
MNSFDYDPADSPDLPSGPRLERDGLPPGTGSLNPAALAEHARAVVQDRQRLLRDLSGTGSLRRGPRLDEAPLTIKQFLRGEIDLDNELSRRFARAPLLTSIARSPQDARPASQATAMLSSQDSSAMLSFDLYSDQDLTELTFTLNHMLAMRFQLENLSPYDKRRWLDLMRRDIGVAFLWTSQRWEADYAIFVLRPHYVRLYAFSPHRFEASVRITHPVARQLINWLDMRWFQSSAAR